MKVKLKLPRSDTDQPTFSEPVSAAIPSGPSAARALPSKRARSAPEAGSDEDYDPTAARSRRARRSKNHGRAAAFGEEDDDSDSELLEYDSDEEGVAGKRTAAGRCGPATAANGAGPPANDNDFSALALKPDHVNRPLWVVPDGRIFLETFSPVYRQAYDFLIAIAEPVCRPEVIHEYTLTPHSLYAAVSVGLETSTIISVLNRLSKVALPDDIIAFVRESTENYGKVKLVLKRNGFYVETSSRDVLQRLLKDSVVAASRKKHVEGAAGAADEDDIVVTKALREHAAHDLARAAEAAAEEGDTGEGNDAEGGDAANGEGAGFVAPAMTEDPEREVLSFEIEADAVERVKQRCLPGGLNYPMLEEYDFRHDAVNPDLDIQLKPHVKLRPYQEKSLSKMFGNGRARSGIIVLPCGAGKSLVGVSAAARVRKSCLVLCTSSVSVDQWRHQFRLWTNLRDDQISRFTSDNKEEFSGVSGITVTTFTMIAFSGKRSRESEEVMARIRQREWGLLLLDEVHVVPAQMFRKVISIVKAHCKLGLTATLVREDERIGDLNFLIGPKLYEANWLDLTRAGHIANVQCAEVWCDMTKEFYREYLKEENASRRQLLYVMNPTKFMACQFLIYFHERVRRDKVIVFSDNIFALREYAMRLGKPFIYGPTSHAERTRILHAFKHNPDVNTVFLSKVGDNSLDIPEANVLIQISSHAGSRRQEAQRLGRILRAKRTKPGAPDAGEFNAFFYTLVSRDTTEMYYSTKRQQFLIDQGYSFKVVTNLLDAAEASLPADAPLLMRSQDEQLTLLAKVLSASEEDAGLEVLPGDDDDLVAHQRGRGGAAGRRVVNANMAALSGAQGLTYYEFDNATKAARQRPVMTARAAAVSRALLKK